MVKLPSHLKKVAKAWDSGRIFNVKTGKPGRKMTNVERKNVAKLSGATFFKNKKGKVIKIIKKK